MSRNLDICINRSENNILRFTLWHSPSNNNINFIKNKSKNIRTKRIYATASVLFGDSIESEIIQFYKDKQIDGFR